jgi:FMN phosphatase YigB (HAD superfamily)
MARGVLWDVGNVIVRWNPRTLYRPYFDDPAAMERFLTDVCSPAWNLRADAGTPMAQNVAELSAQFPHQAALISLWHSRWTDMLSGCIEETTAAMQALHARGVPQYGLTNMESECWPIVTTMSPVFALFDGVVVSGDEKIVKPDARIYQLVIDRFGVAPQDLLFIDDSPANIAAAAAMGFDTHLFDDPSTLLPALQARGLL